MPPCDVEDGNGEEHFHEPGKVVTVDVGTEQHAARGLEEAIYPLCPRSGLEDGEQSKGAGKNQNCKTERVQGATAVAGEKLRGDEEKNQIRGQQDESLACFRRVERKAGPVLDYPKKEEDR